jgi:hypothetical protein
VRPSLESLELDTDDALLDEEESREAARLELESLEFESEEELLDEGESEEKLPEEPLLDVSPLLPPL